MFRRSVPAVLCLSAALTLAGCDSANDDPGAVAAPTADSQPAAVVKAPDTAEDPVTTPAPETAEPLKEEANGPEAMEEPKPPAEKPAPAGPEAAEAIVPATLIPAASQDKPPATESNSKPPASDAQTKPPASDAMIPPPATATGTVTQPPPSDSGPATKPQEDRQRTARPNAASLSINDGSRDTSRSAASAPRIRDREADLAVNAPRLDPSEYFMHVSPEKLELGEIATGDTGVGAVTLSNDGDVEIMPSARSNCGCTTTGLQKGTILQPGESIEVQIRLKAGQTPRKLSKTVTFMFKPDGVHPPLRVPVSGEGRSFVTITPAALVPDTTPEATFVLKAADEQSFRITSMVPGIIEEFPMEQQTEHQIQFDWDTWRELGQPRRVMFYTDHPRCARVTGTIRVARAKPVERPKDPEAEPRTTPSRGARTPEVSPERPAPPPRRPQATKYEDLIKDGNGGQIIEEVNGGLSVETRDGSGCTLLGLAAQYGDIPLMQALIDAGADIDALDTRVGRTALMQAAEGNQVEAIRLLLNSGASLEAKNKMGGTALSWAAGFGGSEAVRELIDQGAQIEVVGIFTGYTPLIWASGFSRDPDSIDALLEAGANIEAAGMVQGATPLIHAARTGKPQGITSLIARGANLEATEFTGQTAFLAACAGSGGTAEKIQVLIDAGANINAKDNQGLGAMELARRRTDLNAEAVVNLLENLFSEAGE